MVDDERFILPLLLLLRRWIVPVVLLLRVLLLELPLYDERLLLLLFELPDTRSELVDVRVVGRVYCSVRAFSTLDGLEYLSEPDTWRVVPVVVVLLLVPVVTRPVVDVLSLLLVVVTRPVAPDDEVLFVTDER